MDLKTGVMGSIWIPESHYTLSLRELLVAAFLAISTVENVPDFVDDSTLSLTLIAHVTFDTLLL